MIKIAGRLVCVVALAALAFPAVASAAGWTTAAAQPPAGAYGLVPLPSGEAFALVNGSGDLLVTRRPAGGSFGAPENVADVQGLRASKLVNVGGAVLLVWTDEDGGHVAEFEPGRGWVIFAGPLGETPDARPSLVATAGGGILAVWREGAELLARESAAGAAFGPVEVIADDLPANGARPEGPAGTATQDGGTVVAWSDLSGTPATGQPGDPDHAPATATARLRLISRPPGGSWGAPAVVGTRTMTADYYDHVYTDYPEIDLSPRPGGGWIMAARTYGVNYSPEPNSGRYRGSDAIEVREGTGAAAGAPATYDEQVITHEYGREAELWQVAIGSAGDVAIAWGRGTRRGDEAFTLHRPAGGAFPAAPASVEMRGTAGVAPLGGDRWYWLDAGYTKFFGQALPLSVSPQNLPLVFDVPDDERVRHFTGDGAGHVLLATEVGSKTPPMRVYDEVAPALSDVAVPATVKPGETARFAARASDLWTTAAVEWDLGDGGTATGNAVEHAYAAPGRYTVKVSAVDAVANRTTETRTVEVPGPPAGDGHGGGRAQQPPSPLPPPIVELVDRVAPVVGALQIRGARRGKRMSLRFSLSEPSTVELRLLRERRGVRRGRKCRTSKAARRKGGRRCVRLVRVARVDFQAGAGQVRRAIGNRGLAPGRYRLKVAVRDAAGNVARPGALKLRRKD